MTGTAKYGRLARVYVDGIVVGNAIDINYDVKAALDKVYAMDSPAPVMLESGNQSYAWSINTLYGVDNTWLAKLLAGTKFDLAFVSTASPYSAPYETLVDCVVSDWGKKAGMTGAIALSVKGEGMGITPTIA
jgi:hypothetical protein